MRPIKFRAWDRQNKAWIYWDHLEGGKSWFWDMVDKYDCELMQFTGLLDKNGKEIWEGDIIRIQSNYELLDSDNYEPVDSMAKVFFSDGAFQTDFHDCLLRIALPGNWIVEVIGDIYEKPELLKDGR